MACAPIPLYPLKLPVRHARMAQIVQKALVKPPPQENPRFLHYILPAAQAAFLHYSFLLISLNGNHLCRTLGILTEPSFC